MATGEYLPAALGLAPTVARLVADIEAFCYDVRIKADAAAHPAAARLLEGGVSMASTCLGCGGPIRSHNKTGYCCLNEKCRRLGNKACKKAAYDRGRDAAPRCKGCDRELRRDNTAGYCTSNPLCRSNYNHIKYTVNGGREQMAGTRLKHPDSIMWSSAQRRAMERGIPFAITREDIRAVWTDTCPVFGYELRTNQAGTGAHARESYSLDRKDNSKGYVPGNLQILSQRANAMKNDASPEELLQFAAWIQATYGAAKGGDAL